MRRESVSDDDEKLIPEWEVEADDQIIWVGLAAFVAALLLAFGWNWLQGEDEPAAAVVDAMLDNGSGHDQETGSDGDAGALAGPTSIDDPVATPTTTPASPATEATGATTTTIPTTTGATSTPGSSGPDLDALSASLSPLPGELTAVVVGSAVTLTGYTANSTEEADAVAAAGAVDGVESVTSDLVLLEPAVTAVLADRGVLIPSVSGVGTEMTVSGTLQAEADRDPTIAAAAAVPGVRSVVDRLEVSVADALNDLPTIPFATGSDTILPDGSAIVAEAASLIIGAGGATFEVQGYTDVTGDDQANQRLSEARAAAVVDALVADGVDPDALVARGFGETEQFAAGTSPEALAANRVVRFLQTG